MLALVHDLVEAEQSKTCFHFGVWRRNSLRRRHLCGVCGSVSHFEMIGKFTAQM